MVALSGYENPGDDRTGSLEKQSSRLRPGHLGSHYFSTFSGSIDRPTASGSRTPVLCVSNESGLSDPFASGTIEDIAHELLICIRDMLTRSENAWKSIPNAITKEYSLKRQLTQRINSKEVELEGKQF
jgi:hypothetical protein